MRKPLHIARTLLLFTLFPLLKSQAQTLSWSNSFSPAWNNGTTNGNATNSGWNGLSIAAGVSLSGGAFTSSSGNATPTVNGTNPQVAGSASRLNLSPNFNSASDYITSVFTFSKTVSNVTFRIADIDKQNPNSNSYYDRVTITGSDGSNTYYPVLTKYDATTDPNFLVISGHVAHANTSNGQGGKTNSNAGDQRGTIIVDFGPALVNAVTIRIDNAPGVQSNPGTQTLAIGEMSFIQPSLPVKLISFSGSQHNNDVLLKWITAQESNSESFRIQRSESGTQWETIGTVAAAGNSSLPLSYSFIDRHAPASALFYRLQQTDLDGQYEYSSVIRISNLDAKSFARYYPNPFSSSVNINLPSASDQNITVVIYDIQGRKILNAVRRLYRGNNSFSLTDLDKLMPGIYQLNLVDENGNSLGQQPLIKR